MSEFSELTSGTISRGTGLVNGLKSCGPRNVTEDVNLPSWPMVTDVAQKDSAAASAKKPMPRKAALREI
jgi:hypothetical protein